MKTENVCDHIDVQSQQFSRIFAQCRHINHKTLRHLLNSFCKVTTIHQREYYTNKNVQKILNSWQLQPKPNQLTIIRSPKCKVIVAFPTTTFKVYTTVVPLSCLFLDIFYPLRDHSVSTVLFQDIVAGYVTIIPTNSRTKKMNLATRNDISQYQFDIRERPLEL